MGLPRPTYQNYVVCTKISSRIYQTCDWLCICAIACVIVCLHVCVSANLRLECCVKTKCPWPVLPELWHLSAYPRATWWATQSMICIQKCPANHRKNASKKSTPSNCWSCRGNTRGAYNMSVKLNFTSTIWFAPTIAKIKRISRHGGISAKKNVLQLGGEECLGGIFFHADGCRYPWGCNFSGEGGQDIKENGTWISDKQL